MIQTCDMAVYNVHVACSAEDKLTNSSTTCGSDLCSELKDRMEVAQTNDAGAST